MRTLLPPDQEAEAFERLYSNEREPWSFSTRAAEVLRHDWIAKTMLRLDPAPRRTLDVGCSQGQLTERLVAGFPDVYAVDVSETAVARTRDRIPNHDVHVAASTVLDLPLASRTFDLAVASDGLYSWNLEAEDRQRALRELHRVLRPGGQILLTEHTRTDRFPEFVAEVESSPLRVLSVAYLYDRPWYQFESWLRAVQHTGVGRALRRNLTIARTLGGIGRLIGPSASRHICVLAMRDA